MQLHTHKKGNKEQFTKMTPTSGSSCHAGNICQKKVKYVQLSFQNTAPCFFTFVVVINRYSFSKFKTFDLAAYNETDLYHLQHSGNMHLLFQH